MRLELTASRATIWRSNQLSYTHHKILLARQKGLEPLAYCLEGSCSIQLSYWRLCAVKTCLKRLFWKRVMGIEPTCSAWKADILPLNYTRTTQATLFILTNLPQFVKGLCMFFP